MKKLFMIIPLVILLCFTFGCQDKEAMVKLEEFKAQAEVEEQNKEIVRQLYEEWDKQNFSINDDLLAPEIKVHMPGSFEPLNLDELKYVVSSFFGAFPNLTHTIDDLIAEGDKVVARITLRMTHKGEFMGIAPTGNDVAFGDLVIMHVEEGKIVEIWAQLDYLWMYQQLGMELKPKEAEK